jgi:hypothetical protein
VPRAALSISPVGTAGSRRPSDPFAEYIAGLDEAGLIDLLALRPDLAVPPPTSLQEVARRANGTKSVQRVTERLDRFSLQVVQALQLADSDRSLSRLFALLGPEAPETEVEHVLEQLQRQVLVSRRAGELLLHPLLAAAATPARLGPPISALVDPLSVDVMRFIARSSGLKLSGKERKADFVSKLMAELPKADRVHQALASVSPSARELATLLAAGPPSVYFPYAAQIYPRYEGRAEPRNEIEMLAWSGLVFPQHWDRCVMPREIAIVLRGGRVFPDLAPHRPQVQPVEVHQDQVDTAAVRAAENAVTVTEGLCERLGAQPAAILKSGGLGVRELRKLADAVSRSVEEVTLFLEIAVAAGLLTVRCQAAPPTGGTKRTGKRGSGRAFAGEPSTAMPTPAFDEWLALSTPQRWGALAFAWRGAESFPSMAGTEVEGERVAPLSQWGGSARAVDHRLVTLSALAGLKIGTAAEPSSLTSAVAWDCPMIIASGPGFPATHVGWVTAEAEALGVMASGSLSTMGRAVAQGDVGNAVTVLGNLLEPVSTELVLQADLTAVAPSSAPWAFRRRLEQIADTESEGAAIVYRFTEASVRRGLDAGLKADDICAFLDAHAPRAIPQPLRYLIHDVARRHGTTRVGSAASFVRFEDAAAAAEVLRSRKTAPLHLRQIAPTVLVTDAQPSAVLQRLRSAGYLPAEEDASGSLVVAAPPCHRGAPRERASTSDVVAGAQVPLRTRALLARELIAGRPAATPDPGASGPNGRSGSSPARPRASGPIGAVFGRKGLRITIDDGPPAHQHPSGGHGWSDREWEDDEDDLDSTYEAMMRLLADNEVQPCDCQRPTSIAKTRDEILGLLGPACDHDWVARVSSTDATGRTSERCVTVLDVSGSEVELLSINGFDAVEVPIAHIQWARVLTEQEEELL